MKLLFYMYYDKIHVKKKFRSHPMVGHSDLAALLSHLRRASQMGARLELGGGPSVTLLELLSPNGGAKVKMVV